MRKPLYILMILGTLFGCSSPAPMPAGRVVAMDYQVQGMEQYPSVRFILRYGEDGRYLLTNASRCAPHEAVTKEVPPSFADQLKRIIDEERMMAYKSEYNSRSHVSDGETWALYVAFDGTGTELRSTGSHARPRGEGLNRLCQLCKNQFK